MKNQLRILSLILAISALVFAGCTLMIDEDRVVQPTDEPTAQESINIAAEAGLAGTTEILIFERTEAAMALEVYDGAIKDSDVIASLVAALEVNMPLIDRQECTEHYRLVFRLSNGSDVDFGYACQLATPSYIGGEQTFWQDRVVIAPDRFNELMAEQLATIPKLEGSRLHIVNSAG